MLLPWMQRLGCLSGMSRFRGDGGHLSVALVANFSGRAK